VASRADASAPAGPASLVRAPRLGAAIRAAFTDYYFNSMRLVPANVVWGAGAIMAVAVIFVWPIGGLVLLAALALPTAGIFRLSARIVRGDPTAGFGDIAWPYRHSTGWLLALGACVVIGGLVLATNVVNGLVDATPLGLVLSTLAAWGLVGLWCAAIVMWPLAVDPNRADRSVRDRLRLAGAVLLVHPVRFATLGLVVAVLAIASAILMVAILTVSVSFIALVACRIVYPVADRIEAGLGVERA
jgi:hypothetical protein